MRIGIDATALPPQLYGAGNYIAQLIQALGHVDGVNEYFVFAKPEHIPLFGSSHVHPISISLSSRFARLAWEQTLFPGQIQRLRLDLAHSPHYTVPLVKTCRTVVTFHDMTFFLYPEMHQAYKRFFFRSIIPLAARRADAIIAASENTRGDIIHLLKTPAAKIWTVPYGISPIFQPIAERAALEQARAKYHLPDKFFIYVGNFEPRKNIPGLLRAFSLARPLESDCWLVLAGTRGWQDTAIFSTLEKLDVSERVLFPGFIAQSDLPAVYCASQALVYPSFYEGFGLPVLEAMACGTPVITSNISSMPEIVGGAGILLDPHDDNELAAAMRRVLTDNDGRAKLALDGLERAKIFSWERAARETLSVYQSTLAR